MRLAVSLFGNEEMEGSPEAGGYLGSANLAPADNIPTSLGNQFRAEIQVAMVLRGSRASSKHAVSFVPNL